MEVVYLFKLANVCTFIKCLSVPRIVPLGKQQERRLLSIPYDETS